MPRIIPPESDFRFREHDTIGAADAADDKFLESCFVDDAGAIDLLKDCLDPHRIVTGNTGAGKTALLMALARKCSRTIRLEPEALAVPYLASSDILTFVAALGVNLAPFFKLLWRHVLAVELLRRRFAISNESSNLLDRILANFSTDKKKHRETLEYLKNYGERFWEETDYRVREVTSTFERDLKTGVKQAVPGLCDLSVEGRLHLTDQEKGEIVKRTRDIINAAQAGDLARIIDLIDLALDDPQQPYYIVIDRLDEDWVDDAVRHRLIRGLLDTVRDFRRVRYAKIIVAIRRDLLRRVFAETRDAGFQEEKFNSITLDLRWSHSALWNLVDRRLRHFCKQRYTQSTMGVDDLLPKKMPPPHNESSGIDYVLDRTLLRPRDAIAFINQCLAKASGRNAITVDVIRSAEKDYSFERLTALADEWRADYPQLLRLAQAAFADRQGTFTPMQMITTKLHDVLFSEMTGESTDKFLRSPLGQACSAYFEQGNPSNQAEEKIAIELLRIFYVTGLISVKLEATERWVSQHDAHRAVLDTELSTSTRARVHPTFHRGLGIAPPR